MFVVIGHGGHNERSVRAESVVQGLDEALGAAVDRPDGAERGVNEQDARGLNAEGE